MYLFIYYFLFYFILFYFFKFSGTNHSWGGGGGKPWSKNGDKCRMGEGELTTFSPDGGPAFPPPKRKNWDKCESNINQHFCVDFNVFFQIILT